MDDWQKLFTRKFGLLRAHIWGKAVIENFKEEFGDAINNFNSLNNGKQSEGYILTHELEQVKNHFRKILTPAYAESLVEKSHCVFSAHLEICTNYHEKKYDHLTPKEFVELFLNLIDAQTKFYAYMWLIWFIDEPLIEKTRGTLKKYHAEDKLTIILTPIKPHDFNEERLELLSIAGKNLTQTKLQAWVKEHASKYAYLPMYDIDYAPLSLDYFMQEVKKLTKYQAKTEFKKIEHEFRQKQEAYAALIKRLHLSLVDEKIMHATNTFAYMKDYRNEIRARESFLLQPFFEAVANQIGLSIAELNLLTVDEIVSVLKSNHSFAKEIAIRKKGYLAAFLRNKYVVSTDKEMQTFIQLLEKSAHIPHTSVRGITAQKGKVIGIAKIVRGFQHLRKILPGDVMVTPMTNPSYIPALEKAIAIVTDEGGMLCHAAIISREMKIPCIIGTKIGTQVIKDGDLIEVDAEKGLVKVLKRV